MKHRAENRETEAADLGILGEELRLEKGVGVPIVPGAPVRIVCDSSALISLAETCNLEALYLLREALPAEFLVTPLVLEESIVRALKIWRFELSAVRLREAAQRGVICSFESSELGDRTRRVLNAANNVFLLDGAPLTILHAGEAECIAALQAARAPVLLVDEKTTRLLLEAPERLRDTLASEFVGTLTISEEALAALRRLVGDVVVMRSAEILALAAEKRFFAPFGEEEKEAFVAALNAVKSTGCAITFEEIQQYAKLPPKPFQAFNEATFCHASPKLQPKG